MDINTTAALIDRLLLPEAQKPQGQQQTAPPQKQVRDQDLINLSKEGQNQSRKNATAGQQNQTRLISEQSEKIENGFRRTQKFAAKDGREFIRIEEFTSTPDRSKHIIVQQNSSGSTTLAENILDRQEDNSFRLTRRFTDEIGATATNIEFNVAPKNIDVLLGRPSTPEQQNNNPFRQDRGTQFDVSA